jgi:hypothetical protein
MPIVKIGRLTLISHGLNDAMRVHHGFLGAAGLQPLFKRREANPAYFAVTALLNTILSRNPDTNPRIIATGHSLRGALAVLYTAMLRYRTKEGLDGNQVKPNDKILSNLEVYTFGQPRIRDPVFAQNNDQLLKDRCYHVVYEKDPVPRVPPDDKVFEYKHFGTCLYYHDGKRR